MKNKCKAAGHHTYLSSEPKPRWCLWCSAKEEVKKPTPKKKLFSKSTKKK